MTQYYAVLQIDGPFYGIGATPEAAIADAKSWGDGDFPDSLPKLPIGSAGRSFDTGTLCIAPISAALYEEIGRDPQCAYHRCVTGLLEVGVSSECEYEGDETPEEAAARARDLMDGLLSQALSIEAAKLHARLAEIKREQAEIAAETSAAKASAAQAWGAWLETMEYAYKTHGVYAANNMPLADRERLAEFTPANVLETARRRGYAPEWATVGHVYRAIEEIKKIDAARRA